ncbi:MAG: hypothetical protein NTZ80_02410 [Patescibacteria group bacterium]|nr:hypothetical protein [Patescibacteria group bacterium]
MNKVKIAAVLFLAIFLAGCFGPSDAELENQQLKKQIEILNSKTKSLQKELGATSTDQELLEEDETGAGNSTETEHLICGGLANFLCPDGYVCLDKAKEPEATGVCIALDKIEEYRAQQRAQAEAIDNPNTTNSSSQTSAKLPCGVLGEKLNRDLKLGDINRTCCSSLFEDRINTTYSICRATRSEVKNPPIASSTTNPVEPKSLAQINSACGGLNMIKCDTDLLCKTETDAPDSNGICITGKDFCSREGEIPLAATGIKCCSGLKIKDGRCTVNYGEYRESATPAALTTTQDEVATEPATSSIAYQVPGYATYTTKNGGFRMKYPSTWYYSGYGASGSYGDDDPSLWLVGFAMKPLDDEGNAATIKANLKEGTPSQRSWHFNSQIFICTKALDSTKYIEVSGPPSLGTSICEMADSATKTE